MKDAWRELSSGPDVPEVVNAVIEIPKGSKNKYEYDKKHGAYKLDRVLHSTVFYPGDYGLIPKTLYDDGDPMDILVMMDEPTFPGCVIPVRPVALIKMRDNNEKDDKILAVPVGNPNYKEINCKEDIPSHRLKEISHFFRTYKLLEEDKDTKVLGWAEKKVAHNAIEHSIDLFQEKKEQGDL